MIKLWVTCVVVAGMMMVGCGGERKTDRRLEKRLQEVERLCVEEDYLRAVAVADEYWFSHPSSIDDVISGQNTLYKDLSESEIRFRQRLANYTRTALIGSGTLVDRFFSYYRTPEIYNTVEDGQQEEYSIAGMLRQRALDNPTAVYTMGINVIEKDGVSGKALSLMVPAMLACQQWNLAEKYIRVWAGLKGWKKEALKYGEVLAFLRNSDSVSVEASDEVKALAEKITDYGQKGLSDYLDADGGLEAECRERWAQNHDSQSVLECVLLYDLLYKDLKHASSLLPAYLRKDENVPLPLQEALLVIQTERIPVTDSVDIEILLPHFGRFLQARDLWQRGLKTPEELTSEFGATFAYNYYFSRFITPPQKTSHQSLMH